MNTNTLNYQDLTQLLADAQVRIRLPDPEVRKALRRSSGLSLRQVGLLLGVSSAAVGHWEAGSRTPNVRHARAYFDLLVELSRSAGVQTAR